MEERGQEPRVTLSRNHFIAIVVGVCILSAAIGSGLALLAETGPAGAAGKQGPRGPAGPQGPEGPPGESADEEIGPLEAEVEDLRDETGAVGDLEGRVEELERALGDQQELSSELCAELELIC
ncbi:MAG TPA: hypothetical protein VFN92_07930 [Solirubrobacterales bacterium]|nr:hypothetical protein [Solirubrobacterales bacterium]